MQKAVEQDIDGHPSADDFFEPDFPNLRPYLESAKHICVTGTTLYLFTVMYAGTLQKKVLDGYELCFVVVNPDGPGVETILARSSIFPTISVVRQELCRTLDNLKALTDLQTRQGQVQVRLVDYDPTLGMSLMDAKQPDGVIVAGIYPQRMSWEIEPTFELNRSRDPYWYQFFLEQFDQMWASAMPWSPVEAAEPVETE